MEEQLERGRAAYAALEEICTKLIETGNYQKIGTSDIRLFLAMYIQALLMRMAQNNGTLSAELQRYTAEVAGRDPLGLGKVSAEQALYIGHKNRSFAEGTPLLLRRCMTMDEKEGTDCANRFVDAVEEILTAAAEMDGECNDRELTFISTYLGSLGTFRMEKTASRHAPEKPGATLSNLLNLGRDKIPGADLLAKNLERMTNLANRDSQSIDKMLDEMETVLDTMPIPQIPTEPAPAAKVPVQADKPAAAAPAKAAAAAKPEEKKPEKTLEELQAELESLIGLTGVKKEVSTLINLIKVRKMREANGMKVMDMSFHMVFTGNPGTGKTTVARLVAQIYSRLGFLSKGQLIETDRSGLVAGYVGQTAQKVTEVVNSALGGILFIDEAYSLTRKGADNDFGKEAVDTLVKLMEDHRDELVVIVAGYTNEMHDFLTSNPGLISRFNKYIDFPDYTDDELMAILAMNTKKQGYKIDEDARAEVRKMLEEMTFQDRADFGNARGMRNTLEKLVQEQANRLAGTEGEITKEMLEQITKADALRALGRGEEPAAEEVPAEEAPVQEAPAEKPEEPAKAE